MVKYTVRIVHRTDYLKKDGTAALILQAFIGQTRVRIPLDVFCRPEEFDSGRQLVKLKDSEKTSRINAIINKYRSRAEEIFFEARLTATPLSADQFKELLDNRPALGLFADWVENEIDKEKTDRASSTIKSYNTVLKWLRKFKPAMTFSDINFGMIQDFDRYLKKNGINENGRAKYHRVVRKFVQLALKKGKRLKNPYTDFKFKEVKVERTWLSTAEVEKLVELYNSRDLEDRLHKCLRHFLFQILTSLRVSDLGRMTLENIEGDLLIFSPKKTGNKIVKVPLSDLAKKLIKDRDGRNGNLFAVYTEPVMNRMLKDIAHLTGIKKKLTTHVGRHTFGFLYLYMGGKIEELREIMGHSKLETTMVYTHVDYSRKVEGVKRFDAIFKAGE